MGVKVYDSTQQAFVDATPKVRSGNAWADGVGKQYDQNEDAWVDDFPEEKWEKWVGSNGELIKTPATSNIITDGYFFGSNKNNGTDYYASLNTGDNNSGVYLDPALNGTVGVCLNGAPYVTSFRMKANMGLAGANCNAAIEYSDDGVNWMTSNSDSFYQITVKTIQCTENNKHKFWRVRITTMSQNTSWMNVTYLMFYGHY